MLLSWHKKTMLPAMPLPPQGTGLLLEHRTLGIRAEGCAGSPPALLAGVSVAAHTEELYMYTYLHPLLDNYRLINAVISSSVNYLSIEEITAAN